MGKGKKGERTAWIPPTNSSSLIKMRRDHIEQESLYLSARVCFRNTWCHHSLHRRNTFKKCSLKNLTQRFELYLHQDNDAYFQIIF